MYTSFALQVFLYNQSHNLAVQLEACHYHSASSVHRNEVDYSY